MRERSLKEVLPKMTGLILILFLLLILPLNFWLQLHLLHQNQLESTKEMFGQLEQMIWRTRNRNLNRAVSVRQIWWHIISRGPQEISEIWTM